MKNPHLQCLFEQDGQRTVGWIEKRGAKMGARIVLKGEAGLLNVLAVYGPELELSDLQEKQRRDRDSLPSIRKHKT